MHADAMSSSTSPWALVGKPPPRSAQRAERVRGLPRLKRQALLRAIQAPVAPERAGFAGSFWSFPTAGFAPKFALFAAIWVEIGPRRAPWPAQSGPPTSASAVRGRAMLSRSAQGRPRAPGARHGRLPHARSSLDGRESWRAVLISATPLTTQPPPPADTHVAVNRT